MSADDYKDIIIDSLKTMVTEKRIELNAFVIMHTHIHLIQPALPGHSPESILAGFMKFTAHKMKQKLSIEDTYLLEKFKVNK